MAITDQQRKDHLQDSVDELERGISVLEGVHAETTAARDKYAAKADVQEAELGNFRADLEQKRTELADVSARVAQQEADAQAQQEADSEGE